ncbi:peptide chain release factor N(5)-glutamine methyltransferase [Luteimonas aestuarii]|uniref:Peptide chain release factor N(5)-glutamine methyltransferase n=1 Tax=Luteimonas aestuarii TaxID=453837 RepID=A0A4R5U4Z6_9GAMM|nr:HemK/PrmC family methyltransferase [Luteimonas aestuarii]TDK28673.1 peptide chain release factor N(5)-glutamine methyltransferase [Luteimonas aestuarii]
MTPTPAYASRLRRLQDNWQAAPDKPEETPRNTLLALWSTAAGAPLSAVSASDIALPALDEDAERCLDTLLDRRIDGVPLAHLTGRQHFLGMDLLAGPGALIPRRETELLGRAAIALAREACEGGRAAVAIDVCTGSGNLALALVHHVAGLTVHGADLSEAAVALARRNAATLALDARVSFQAGDLLAPFETAAFHGSVDLLTCNPPYISSGKVGAMPAEISSHEPRLAFDGGPLGVSLLSRLMQDAPRFVRAGGWLAFEVGLGQGAAMARRLRNDPAWGDVRELVDDAGAVRALLAQRAASGTGASA